MSIAELPLTLIAWSQPVSQRSDMPSIVNCTEITTKILDSATTFLRATHNRLPSCLVSSFGFEDRPRWSRCNLVIRTPTISQRYVLMLKREKRLVFRSTLGRHAKAVASLLKTPFCTALCYTDYFTG